MDNTEALKQLQKLFDKYKLGKFTENPKQITGGLMHRIYQVVTDEKKYAVKELNSSIMKRKGVVENIINSESIAEALKEIVSVITAIKFEDTSLLILDGKYYMVFEWLDGISLFPPDISLENCRKIGLLLGKIHTAEIILPNIKKETHDIELYDWNKYLLLGQETGAKWTKELILVIDDLKKWNQESIEANTLLSKHLVLSHRDLDPKNVMWKDDNPYLIDWEAAGYINPYQELLEVLNYWSNTGKGEIDKGKFMILYAAYIGIAENCKVSWDVVLSGGFAGMLGWLNYSFKRSLGIEASSIEEINLGTEQVFDTTKALIQYSQQRKLLKKFLMEEILC